MIFEDRSGRELCKIQERMLRIKESMEIEDATGQQIAMVKKALITPLRERWTINLRGGPDLEIQGNILDHEYRIERGPRPGGRGLEKWFRLRDSYGVEIDPGQGGILILAATVAVDMMAHPAR